MKTTSLYILRHAKSDWSAGLDDHERDLNARGERAARTVGRFLDRAEQTPDAVLVSSAVRTRRTLELASAAGGWTASTQVLSELYESHPDAVLEAIRRVASSVTRLLVVGHEPTSSELTRQLCGFADASGRAFGEDGRPLPGSLRFPTATLARIDFAIGAGSLGADASGAHERSPWSTIGYGQGQLVFLVPPKLFSPDGFDFAE